ncbi:MAG: sigma-70 family RNA polymerase sigma factor [Planctomycetota bacterium]|nr:MAG: sigma-70 family RNA polymerase sigma factor [Planctomycetota bacterium]
MRAAAGSSCIAAVATLDGCPAPPHDRAHGDRRRTPWSEEGERVESAAGSGPRRGASPAAVASDEAALVARARAGDFAAFDELVTRHEGRVYAIARHLVGPVDAEDVVQQTFLSALEHLDGFREEASFGTWVGRIASRAALKLLRKQRRERSLPVGDDGAVLPHPELIAPWKENPLERVQQRELRAQLDEAIEALPPQHREVFVLRELAGLSVRETAQALGISESNVKVRHFRARMALREALTRRFGDLSRRLQPGHPARGTTP